MPNTRLLILGTGEAFDTGVGNNSCLLLAPGASVLFDCGYQIPERLWLNAAYRKLDAVVFSHLHADHCFGIVPLLMRFWEEGRRAPFWIAGRRGTEKYVRELFELGYPGLYRKLSFELKFKEVTAGDSWSWKKLRFRFAHTSHSVENLAARIDGANWSLGVSGDGQLTKESRELFQNVDFLVHELYSLKPKTPVHCDFETLHEYISYSKVGRVGVTHHARSERVALQRKIRTLRDPRWVALKPGMEFRL